MLTIKSWKYRRKGFLKKNINAQPITLFVVNSATYH
jgi:hypothetical protein